MAFARSAAPRAPVQRHRHEHVLPLSAPEPRVAMLKDLRKMRKALNEKLEHALALKGDVNSVHQQLRYIGDAFDTLSQVSRTIPPDWPKEPPSLSSLFADLYNQAGDRMVLQMRLQFFSPRGLCLRFDSHFSASRLSPLMQPCLVCPTFCFPPGPCR